MQQKTLKKRKCEELVENLLATLEHDYPTVNVKIETINQIKETYIRQYCPVFLCRYSSIQLSNNDHSLTIKKPQTNDDGIGKHVIGHIIMII